jgi:putative flippase GtrA
MNQTVAWIIAVIFAYITNRIFVFNSNGPVFKEFIVFISSRIATLLAFELGTFELFVLLLQNVIGIDKNVAAFSIFGQTCTYLYLVKLFNSVFVVIGNYILSKIFVFRTKQVPKNDEDSEAVYKECDRDGEK